MPCEWTDKIFAVTNAGFESLALEIFHFQYKHNFLYKNYADAINVVPDRVTCLNEIPFLPVNFFKTHTVQTTSFTPEMIFESSGTTQTINSRHFIKDVTLYERSFIQGFEFFYGSAREWCIIGLLPSYLERNNSSLVYMVRNLIAMSTHRQSGFYLYEYDKLAELLIQLEEKSKRH